LANENVETIRQLCVASENRLPFRNVDDVSAAFAHETEFLPPSMQWFAKRLESLIVVSAQTDLHVSNIRGAAMVFALEAAIGKRESDWEPTLISIASCTPVDKYLLPFHDSAWERAIDIGRALAFLKTFPHPNARVEAVAAAGRRLHAQGYRLSVGENSYNFEDGEIERATEIVRTTFAEFGSVNCLTNLFGALKKIYPYDFDMYLPGRISGMGLGLRDASIPFGFAINLAVAAPIPRSVPAEPQRKWKEALELARDIVSALNVESFSGFAHMGTSTLYAEAALRELAMFDHLFGLRQWRLSFTQDFLTDFFNSDHDDVFRSKLGWTPADVVALCGAVRVFANSDPKVITMGALRQSGIRPDLLNRLLPYFVHAQGVVNARYLSPFSATKADFLFKPLIQLGPNHLLLPATSLMGPAFYEATMGALRKFISMPAADKLQGDGTERVVIGLFRRAKFNPTFVAKKYVDAPDDGECDLVLESDADILLVECKAKALTRGAMAGVQGDALLDFAGGMFAAQTQALRHERILRSVGHIEFTDGSRLEMRDRRITRLSVTLLDHGALQDRMTLANMFGAMLGASFKTTPGYSKSGQVDKLNKTLNDLRSEVAKLEAAGQNVNAQRLNAASLNVGQLEVILEGVADLEQFRKRVAQPTTMMTLNPLLEYHYLHQKGIAP
jgi:hypothetical protein